MFDKFINSIKDFVPNLLWFAVAGLTIGVVAPFLFGDGGFDIMAIIQDGVLAVVAGFMTALWISAMDNGS